MFLLFLTSLLSVTRPPHHDHLASSPFITNLRPTPFPADTAVLEAARASCYTSVELLVDSLGWTEQRAETALDFMVAEGMGWVDIQAEGKWPQVWFMTFFSQRASKASREAAP